MSETVHNYTQDEYKVFETFRSLLESESDDRILDEVITTLIHENAMTGDKDIDNSVSKWFACSLLLSRGYVKTAIALNNVCRVSEVKT